MKKTLFVLSAVAVFALSAATLAGAKIYITGYDANDNYKPVQVEVGTYNPGISLYPPEETQEETLGGFPVMKAITPMDAVTATTTSDAIDIKGAKKVTLFLDQDLVNANAGLATTTFAVTVSTDDTTYITYNKLIDNLTNTNSQGLTRVASKVVDDGTDYILSMDLEYDSFSTFKISATTATTEPIASSTVTVKALIEF